MLFVGDTNDEIVPAPHIRRLHDAAVLAPFKQIFMVQGETHNDTWLKGGKDYIYALKDFIDKCQEYHLQQLTQGSNNQNGSASGPTLGFSSYRLS
jgi:hypothetical protein